MGFLSLKNFLDVIHKQAQRNYIANLEWHEWLLFVQVISGTGVLLGLTFMLQINTLL